jgi:hypothetical protein
VLIGELRAAVRWPVVASRGGSKGRRQLRIRA